MKTTYHTIYCGGWNPRTRKRVGSRHRWEFGMCKWCGRFKDDVRVKDKPVLKPVC